MKESNYAFKEITASIHFPRLVDVFKRAQEACQVAEDRGEVVPDVSDMVTEAAAEFKLDLNALIPDHDWSIPMDQITITVQRLDELSMCAKNLSRAFARFEEQVSKLESTFLSEERAFKMSADW